MAIKVQFQIDFVASPAIFFVNFNRFEIKLLAILGRF